MTVNFDCNNIYQTGEKKIGQITEILTEIKGRLDTKKDFIDFITAKLQ